MDKGINKEREVNFGFIPQDIYFPLYLDTEHFIILITGGRGSGKSSNASTFIERLTFEMTEAQKIVHQILYTRYTMVSAGMSIIPEMMEKIDLDGTTKYFKTTKTDIVNKMTKSRIMFRGIKTSSGNQTAKLKSIHALTTFVCDEAEEWTDENSFDKIMLSIRQIGIQNRIMIIMNPTDSNHFIYKKYIEKTHKLVEIDGVQVQVSTHPNVLHIHTTYLNNLENLSPEFLKEVEDMKVNNPEKYAHVVIGRWADVAEGAVFKKWGIVKEFPVHAKKVALASDWGYTNDPSTGIRCGIVDNRLYVDELFYETGMLTNAIAEKLKPWGLKVYGDSADPRLIQEIKNRGVNIYPVDKFPGSIKAGIDKIHEMELFVTERSYHIIEELRKYVWDKDKDGHYINEPVDAWNHCIDPIRYYILGHILGRILKPKDLTGIFTH
ncbi:PBSX family phage terminase large subunit [Bacteroides nordii]|uniref:PBSX family phage terminase large subunit n=1 Tax=Bacteroides nordii TaxID=291645 RepID=UPI0034A27350